MKTLDIAMFIFITNIVLSMLAQSGIFGSYLSVSADQGIIDDVNTAIHDQLKPFADPTTGSIFDSFALIALALADAVTTLISITWNSTLGLPGLLIRFYLPAAAAWALGVIANITYTIGILQFLSGRSTKEAQ